VKVKFNDIHTMAVRMPGYYGILNRDDIIDIDKKLFDDELKEKVNANGESLWLPVKEPKKAEQITE